MTGRKRVNIMTKKAERILNELEKKLNMYVLMYKHDAGTFGYCYSKIREEKTLCFDMVSYMHHFRLLNEKDLNFLYKQIMILGDEYVDTINRLYVEKTGYIR